MLESDGSNYAVSLPAIKKMQVLEQPLRVHVASENASAPAKTTLGMAYLRKGIAWIPRSTPSR